MFGPAVALVDVDRPHFGVELDVVFAEVLFSAAEGVPADIQETTPFRGRGECGIHKMSLNGCYVLRVTQVGVIRLERNPILWQLDEVGTCSKTVESMSVFAPCQLRA